MRLTWIECLVIGLIVGLFGLLCLPIVDAIAASSPVPEESFVESVQFSPAHVETWTQMIPAGNGIVVPVTHVDSVPDQWFAKLSTGDRIRVSQQQFGSLRPGDRLVIRVAKGGLVGMRSVKSWDRAECVHREAVR